MNESVKTRNKKKKKEKAESYSLIPRKGHRNCTHEPQVRHLVASIVLEVSHVDSGECARGGVCYWRGGKGACG